jgi:hypothetical protein
MKIALVTDGNQTTGIATENGYTFSPETIERAGAILQEKENLALEFDQRRDLLVYHLGLERGAANDLHQFLNLSGTWTICDISDLQR